MTAQALVPPPNPYAQVAPQQGVPMAATLRGMGGQFTVRAGSEVRVGRDPSQCPILIEEPRISGVHATLKFERGSLLVRDEMSNNGTWVSGARIPGGAWTPVTPGMALRFGPIEFSVQLEG
jgi:hypothetical protein